MRKYSLLFAALLATGCSLAEGGKQPPQPELNNSQVHFSKESAKASTKAKCTTVYRHKRTPIRQCQPVKQGS